MKKITVLLILLIASTLLCACSNTSAKIVKKDDKYYLVLNDLPEKDLTGGCKPAVAVFFDSAEEMYSDLKNGTFTDEELQTIAEFRRDEYDRIPLWDMSKPCIPYHPTAMADYQYTWTGGTFEIVYYINDARFLWWRWDTLEDLEGTLMAHPEYDLHPWKETRTFTDGETTYWLRKHYGTEDFNNAIPNKIDLYVARGDQFFSVRIRDLGHDVTDEWLMQFELLPYTEN